VGARVPGGLGVEQRTADARHHARTQRLLRLDSLIIGLDVLPSRSRGVRGRDHLYVDRPRDGCKPVRERTDRGDGDRRRTTRTTTARARSRNLGTTRHFPVKATSPGQCARAYQGQMATEAPMAGTSEVSLQSTITVRGAMKIAPNGKNWAIADKPRRIRIPRVADPVG
jgi:hypothetical protein